MPSNPEFNNNRPTNDEVNRQDILPKDNFYQFRQKTEEAFRNEQATMAKRRNEELKNNTEAFEKVKSVAKKFAATAAIAFLIMSGLSATGSRKDFLKSDEARQQVIEMENVEEVIFYGNARSNPEIPNSEDPSNVYTNIEDEVRFKVSEDTKILYLRDDSDPNGGGWIGIPAEELAKEHYISEKAANEILKHEEESKKGDGYTWFNTANARTVTAE